VIFLSLARLITIILSIISITMVIPVGVALYYGEFHVISGFAIPGIICIFFAILFFFITRKKNFHLSSRAGFGAVALSWIFASLLGAMPFFITGYSPSFADAFFESASGFTTTGATIFSDVESLPRSINLWRSQMHWLGGMGIVALTVALLPLLGVGGFQLIKAETTGPEKGKITPKITVTAKILWFIYLGFTILQTVLLLFAGMDFVDALSHSFATLGTGGFSTRNASISSYNSALIDWICTIFMFLGGVNFSLYYHLIVRHGSEIKDNTELKAYIIIFLIASLGITVCVIPQYGSFVNALRHGAFQVASIMTTTGFYTADYTQWPQFAQIIIFALMLIGGCSGSTAGGVKVIRWVILGKQMGNEMRRMIHPHGIFSIQINKRVGRKDIVYNVAAFMFLYSVLVLITTLVASLNNIDLLSSLTASLTLVGNIGPGFGAVGPVQNFGFFNDVSKYWFSFVMIAGRLELYTMLIFFMPSFWKK
jgi:trk system potassium uptake protein TrkH